MFGEGKGDNRELISILSTMSNMTAWLDDPVIHPTIGWIANKVLRHTGEQAEVRFDDLKGLDGNGKSIKGAVISCVVPLQYMETHAPLVRVMLGCAILTMQRGK